MNTQTVNEHRALGINNQKNENKETFFCCCCCCRCVRKRKFQFIFVIWIMNVKYAVMKTTFEQCTTEIMLNFLFILFNSLHCIWIGIGIQWVNSKSIWNQIKFGPFIRFTNEMIKELNIWQATKQLFNYCSLFAGFVICCTQFSLQCNLKFR